MKKEEAKKVETKKAEPVKAAEPVVKEEPVSRYAPKEEEKANEEPASNLKLRKGPRPRGMAKFKAVKLQEPELADIDPSELSENQKRKL